MRYGPRTKREGPRKKRREFEKELEGFIRKLVKEYVSKDPANTNIVSLMFYAFVEAGTKFLRSPHAENFVSIFSRTLADSLTKSKAFECSRYKRVFEEVQAIFDEVKRGLGNRFHVYEVKFTTSTRLLVHVSGHYLPLYVSTAWDYVRNVPFIPSSSLKGVARAYFEQLDTPVEGLKADDLFGSENSEGAVVITDAYPVGCRDTLVEPEVITPHYVEAEGRIDEVSARPRPIVFLAVSPEVTFESLVLVRRKLGGHELGEDRAKQIVSRILEAFIAMGLGAKISVGYGRVKRVAKEGEPKQASLEASR